jgi:hypothetical protein
MTRSTATRIGAITLASATLAVGFAGTCLRQGRRRDP